MQDDQPLSLKEVAKLLGVTAKTVQRYIRERRFPPAGYTAGGAQCWFMEDVRAYRHFSMRGTWKPHGDELAPDQEAEH